MLSVAVVISLDGKLTRHDEADVKSWASPEDQTNFYVLIAEHEVVIMGRHGYEAARPALNLDLAVRRIVLTSEPEQFADQTVKGRLEFVNQPAAALIAQLHGQGISKILIVGGPRIIGDLLKAKLVDQLFVTIEPRLFGHGVTLLHDYPVDIKLSLVESRQINPTGTLLLKYKIT